jgi:hypothetical protein
MYIFSLTWFYYLSHFDSLVNSMTNNEEEDIYRFCTLKLLQSHNDETRDADKGVGKKRTTNKRVLCKRQFI